MKDSICFPSMKKDGLVLLYFPGSESNPGLWQQGAGSKVSQGVIRCQRIFRTTYLCRVKRNKPSPGTKLQKSCYKIPRILQQVSPDVAAACALLLPTFFRIIITFEKGHHQHSVQKKL